MSGVSFHLRVVSILYDIGWTYVILAEIVKTRVAASGTWWRPRAKVSISIACTRHHRHRDCGISVPLAFGRCFEKVLFPGVGPPRPMSAPVKAQPHAS